MEYYSHTIRITNFNLIDIERVEQILKSGYIYSRRNLQNTINFDKERLGEETSLFNGMDYVSLCDLSKEKTDYSAYNMYVKRGLSFLFNKRIEVILPIIINTKVGGYSFFGDAHLFGLQEKRYSDLPDEVQIKDKISLSYLEGMAISVGQIEKYHEKDYVIEYLKLLKSVLTKYEKYVPIINIDTEKELLVDNHKIY